MVVIGEGVAERHCQIVFDVDGYWLEDLLSPTGTYVNGEPISSRMLREGDTIHLGAAAFTFANGGLSRQVNADVEQSLEVTETPPLSKFSPEIPDDSPPIRTPRVTKRAHRVGKLSMSARVTASSFLAIVVGIAFLVVLASSDSDKISRPENNEEPSPSGLTIAERAFQIVESKHRQSPCEAPRFSLLMSPKIPATWEDNIEAHLSNSNRFWACELPPNEPVIVRMAHPDDKDWLIDQLLETPYFSTREEAEAQAERDDLAGFAYKSALFLTPPPGMTRVKDFGAVIAHEWFHHVQFSLEGWVPAALPCWWYEGHASYLGIAVEAVGISTLENFGSFQRARRFGVEGWSTDEAYGRSTTNWYRWLKAQEPGEGLWNSCEEDFFPDVYGAGFLVSEYLIGQYGLEAVTKVHGDFKYSVDWETRVSRVFGKSTDALLNEIAAYLSSSFNNMF